MSRLVLPNRVCAKCTLLAAHESPLLTPRGAVARVKPQLSDKRSVFIQQQRRYVGGSNTEFFRNRLKSKVWMCGVGVGIALAVGLKYHSDTASSPHVVDEVSEAQKTDRYSNAIKVSRDLVERIKVGTEVGLWTEWLLIGHFSCVLSLLPVKL